MPAADAPILTPQKALRDAIKQSAEPALLRGLYEANGLKPLFYVDREPTDAAHALHRAVSDLQHHGMDRAPFGLGFTADDPRVLRRRRKRATKTLQLEIKRADTVTELARTDVRLAGALVRYVLEFTILRHAHPTTPRPDTTDLEDDEAEKVIALAFKAVTNPARALPRLWPATSQYEALRKALADYKKRATEPKPPKLTWKRYKRRPKRRAAQMTRLQARLADEGFYQGPPTGELDAPTIQALKGFRTRYGLATSEVVAADVIREINVPAAMRVAHIRAALQRLRESEPLRRGLTTYARVNIPSFAMTLYEKGQATRSHRVIVGNSRLDFDRTGWRQGFLNRTPLLETHMLEVVLNPSWRPPPRIRDEEFDGREDVVVPPGPRNPLGYVKFILDRTNAVFLHDTNKRKLFGKHRRPFSHGCVRVDQALPLAKHLLRHFADIDDIEYQERLESRNEHKIPLTRELPVFVEYSTVEIDADGAPVFHRDVYRYDRAWLKGRTPRTTVRYGSKVLRPKAVPLVPVEDYRQMKADRTKAPLDWPPGSFEE
ncbi:MAG: murein L,D-transpeptidase YcbB/YkuD [Myxococcota bacterium]|jgi:murein L,D-transpeptidase YcbB/YkuD